MLGFQKIYNNRSQRMELVFFVFAISRAREGLNWTFAWKKDEPLYYLMKYHSYELLGAVKLLHQFHPSIYPNNGFLDLPTKI